MVSQGLYEHYKSTSEDPKLYQVLFLSHNESDLKVLVHYVPLYYSNTHAESNDGIAIWTRTLENFMETVEWNGETIPRFKQISSTIR